jgi:hypothetical protein
LNSSIKNYFNLQRIQIIEGDIVRYWGLLEYDLLLFITLILPLASLSKAIAIPTWPRLNGKRFSGSRANLRLWRWHIEWRYVSQGARIVSGGSSV